MRTRDRDVVAALELAIAQRIGAPRYKFWFERNTKVRWDDGQVVVGVPNHFFQEWLQDKFAESVRAAAGEALGIAPPAVRFVIDPELFQAARRAQGECRQTDSSPAQVPAPAKKPGKEPREPEAPLFPVEIQAKPAAPKRSRHWRRLGEFVVGACNRLAHAAALSTVEAPGQDANPLVLHGPVGTGKTHLLEGIYAGLRKSQPSWRVCYVTAEDFTNRFVQGLRFGKLAAFRKHFRECDALLIDDIQFVAGKRASQEEFLHTLDSLLRDGKPVIATCDCHPRLANEFPPELTDRLLGGAVWGLTPPDAATRLDILRAKSSRTGLMAEEVLRFLADQLSGNVRELEGALHTIQHYARVTGKPIDLNLAREAVGDLLRHSIRVFQLSDVDRAVCQVLHLDAGTLQKKQRAWAVSHPRMLAMYLARRHTAAAYSEIGRYFGGRNHATVVAAEKKVRQWLQANGQVELGERRLRVRELVELAERELRK